MTREGRLWHALWRAEGRAERRRRVQAGGLRYWQAARLVRRLDAALLAEQYATR